MYSHRKVHHAWYFRRKRSGNWRHGPGLRSRLQAIEASHLFSVTANVEVAIFSMTSWKRCEFSFGDLNQLERFSLSISLWTSLSICRSVEPTMYPCSNASLSWARKDFGYCASLGSFPTRVSQYAENAPSIVGLMR